MASALVIGGTGLIGSTLIDQLLVDDRFDEVHSIGRRKTGRINGKLKETVIDFDSPDTWRRLIVGDVLFSTLGTTLKDAGSKDRQYEIDHDYQYNMAHAAANNDVACYVLVSAIGADPDSNMFYSRMKGELEENIRQLPFRHIQVIRPSLLLGDRENPRFGEELSEKVLKGVNKLGLFKKYQPLQAETVAKAMIAASFRPETKIEFHEPKQIVRLAESEK